MLLPSAAAMALEEPMRRLAVDGFAPIGRVLSDGGLGGLRDRADDIMLGRAPGNPFFFQHDGDTGRYEDLRFGQGWEGPSLRYRKIEKLERDDRFLAWLSNALFERIARSLVGDEVSIYRAVLMTKGATGGTELPWHQDAGSFWGLDTTPRLQIWTALDDAPEDGGCLEMIPGSHRAGLATPLGGLVPEPIARPREAERVLVPARAGEAVLLDNLTWHRSRRSTTGHPRRAFSVCYMPAATRCLRRKRAPRQFVRVFVPQRSGPA